MAISAQMVKALRDRTGAGMMDAKKALSEVDGDIEAAVDWLRSKGLSKAAKKSDRTAAEGLVAARVGGGSGVLVEVNAETDFVAKNADFQTMVARIAERALTVGDVDALGAADMDGASVSDQITEAIATIGENMTLRRMAKLEGERVVSYVHNQVAEGLGKIGVLVAASGDDQGLARQVAMHVAAANPASLSEADLDPAILDRERAVLTQQARESGKPEQVIEKMIEGRMKKYLSEVTLLGQAFVVDPDKTVAEALDEAGVTVTGFRRYEVGEGKETREEDFAEEVAKAAGG